MKKLLLLSLAAAAAFAYKPDYEQIWLPTPKAAPTAKSEQAANLRFVLDERAAVKNSTGKQIGELFEGTPVELVSKKNGVATVKISGKVVGKTLAFTKDGEFVYGEFAAAPSETMTLQIDEKSLTASRAEAFDAVETFYYDSCTSCHAAHAPHEHAIDEWDAYIGAMQMNAKISDEQKDRILRFMQAHAAGGQFKAE